MFKNIRFLLLVLVAASAMAQPLRDINYSYAYNPDEAVRLQLHPVRTSTEWQVFYALQVKDTTDANKKFSIEWTTRESLSDKEGKPLQTDSAGQISDRLTLPLSPQTTYLVAKVINKQIKRAWIFYTTLDPNYPVNAWVERNGEVVSNAFVNLRDSFIVKGLTTAVVSYYNDNFPTAQPPFAETQGKVSRGMKSDSVFTIREGGVLRFSKKGLYLMQTDTNATSGVTIRVEDDYPKLAKIQTLAPPLVYITTAQEYNRLLSAKNEKKQFDRVVLGITNDQERARRLMRNYFRRVEVVNELFTSYKEGWKTDRGMVYIVFGLPDEVFKFSDREVWNYNSTGQNMSFTFIKSSSVFDPDNYVLLRDKKYQQAWYETIDLWRGSRF
ncbi:MAG TPA: GWxTD domain-containing protein [Chryseosolibacter sp.]